MSAGTTKHLSHALQGFGAANSGTTKHLSHALVQPILAPQSTSVMLYKALAQPIRATWCPTDGVHTSAAPHRAGTLPKWLNDLKAPLSCDCPVLFMTGQGQKRRIESKKEANRGNMRWMQPPKETC